MGLILGGGDQLVEAGLHMAQGIQIDGIPLSFLFGVRHELFHGSSMVTNPTP